MTNINVSYSELNSKAESLSTGKEEILGILNRLQAQITALVTQGFATDHASGAFGEAYNRFSVGSANAISGLEDLAVFLRATAQTLGELDSALAARLAA